MMCDYLVNVYVILFGVSILYLIGAVFFVNKFDL